MLQWHPLACVFLTDTLKVVSLVSPQIGPGPLNLVLPIQNVGEQLGQAPIGWIAHGEIQLDSTSIALGEAEIWDPSPDWNRIRDQVLSQTFSWAAILQEAPAYAGAKSLKEWLDVEGPDSTFASQIMDKTGAFDDLLYGYRDGDRLRCLQGATGLVGWGPGLTPLGDDLLIGFLLASYLFKPIKVAKADGKNLVAAVKGRTTTLSEAFLLVASEGKCGRDWHDLFRGMVTDDLSLQKQAIQEIISTGHSSGSAALAAFLHTIQALLLI